MIWLGLLETHKPRQQVAWLKSWSQADFVLRGLDTQLPGSQCPQQQLGGGDSQEGMAPNFMLLSDSGLVALLPLWLSWQIICLQRGRPEFNPCVGKILWRRKRLPTPVFWPGEFHGPYSPWGCKEVRHDWATFTFTFLSFNPSTP